jgi:hypothetical protein
MKSGHWLPTVPMIAFSVLLKKQYTSSYFTQTITCNTIIHTEINSGNTPIRIGRKLRNLPLADGEWDAQRLDEARALARRQERNLIQLAFNEFVYFSSIPK